MTTTSSSPKRFCLNLALLASAVGFVAVGCKPSAPPTPPPAMQTFETQKVESAIASYRRAPSEEAKRGVDLALSEMESEINELAVRSGKVSGADKAENDRKLADLREKYARYRTDFAAAQAEATTKSATEATTDALKKAGDATERAVEKTGDAIKDAAHSVGDALNPNK